MKKEIEFIIDEQIEKKFKIALMLSGDDENKLLEGWVQKYIQMVFSKEAGVEVVEEQSDNNTINKIRKWVTKDNVPSKIIKAFLKCCDDSYISANKYDMMCKFVEMQLSEENPELIEQLRKKFNTNYPQMKSNGAHAHGKVFYDDGENVYLVEEIRDEILKLKEKFLK